MVGFAVALTSLAVNPLQPPSPFPPPSAPPSLPPSPPPIGWDDDLHALTTLYAATNGTRWRNRNNWGDVHPCVSSWQGERCDASGADDGTCRLLDLAADGAALACRTGRRLG